MHHFTISHFTIAVLAVGPAHCAISAVIRRFRSDTEHPALVVLRTAAAVYIAMIVANVAVDREFKISGTGPAAVDAAHDARDLWRWGAQAWREHR